MLRSLCLAAHHNACGLVGEAYGAVGFVDMLAAGTTGAKCVDLMGGGGGSRGQEGGGGSGGQDQKGKC